MVQPELELNIIRGLKKRHSHAINYLFKRHYKPLCYFAWQLTGNKAEAEDIAGDVFLKLWRKHNDFETLRNIKAFLYIATRNACFDYLKHLQRKNASHEELLYLAESSEDLIEAHIIKSEILRNILFEVETLPPVRKQIFKLIYLENLTTSEIAQKLNITTDTVRVQKARALNLLRTQLLKNGFISLNTILVSGLFLFFLCK
jgi:RNA polymerase sigma-70 factor (ECF subfamily)